MSDEPTAAPVVTYVRRGRTPAGMFAGLYVTLGAVNLIVGGAELVAGAGLLWLVAYARATAKIQTHQIPFDTVVMAAFGVLCGGLIVAGSVGSFWRDRRSRSIVRAGLAGDAVVNGLALASLVLHAGPFAGTVLPPWAMAATVARTAYVAAAFWAYSDLRADFYFKPDRTARQVFGPAADEAADEAAPAAADLPRPRPVEAATFDVTGIDAASGQPVGLRSKAATEALARKSAVAMGMVPDSIDVRPLSPLT